MVAKLFQVINRDSSSALVNLLCSCNAVPNEHKAS